MRFLYYKFSVIELSETTQTENPCIIKAYLCFICMLDFVSTFSDVDNLMTVCLYMFMWEIPHHNFVYTVFSMWTDYNVRQTAILVPSNTALCDKFFRKVFYYLGIRILSCNKSCLIGHVRILAESPETWLESPDSTFSLLPSSPPTIRRQSSLLSQGFGPPLKAFLIRVIAQINCIYIMCIAMFSRA